MRREIAGPPSRHNPSTRVAVQSFGISMGHCLVLVSGLDKSMKTTKIGFSRITRTLNVTVSELDTTVLSQKWYLLQSVVICVQARGNVDHALENAVREKKKFHGC